MITGEVWLALTPCFFARDCSSARERLSRSISEELWLEEDGPGIEERTGGLGALVMTSMFDSSKYPGGKIKWVRPKAEPTRVAVKAYG